MPNKRCSLALLLLHLQHYITEYLISSNSLQSISLQNTCILLTTTAWPDYLYILIKSLNAWTIWMLNLFLEKSLGLDSPCKTSGNTKISMFFATLQSITSFFLKSNMSSFFEYFVQWNYNMKLKFLKNIFPKYLF